MDDATYNDTVSRVNAVIKDLKHALNLQADIRVEYIRDQPTVDCEGGATLMEMHTNWEYAAATMVVSVPPCVSMATDDLAEKILHEFVHYYVDPMSQWGKSEEYNLLEERTCTDIAFAIKSAMEATADELNDHWSKKVKDLEKQVKKLEKGKVA